MFIVVKNSKNLIWCKQNTERKYFTCLFIQNKNKTLTFVPRVIFVII